MSEKRLPKRAVIALNDSATLGGGGGGGSGDITGAANVGATGVGVFKNEAAGVLNFKKLTGDGVVTVTDDTGSDEIDLALDPAGIDHQDLTGAGSQSHAAIDSHIAAANPHSGSQPLDAELTAIAGLTSAADKGIQFTGAGTAATFDLTTAGKALLDDANASAQRTTLGLGGAAVLAVGTGAGDVAAGNRGVTNGDSHDHAGGDGGQIAHSALSGAGSTSHADLDTHVGAANPHSGSQPLDGMLTALAALDATAGLLEQTGADAIARRALGVGASTSVPTRADADARYAALAHATQHQHGGSDQIATATAAANAIPKANGSGILANEWLATSGTPSSSTYLRGDRVWATPSGGGGGGGGGLVYANTDVPGGNTVASTAAETAFTSSYTIPAGTLGAGDVVVVRLTGLYGTNAVPPTLTLKLKLGSTTMLSSGALTTVGAITAGGWTSDAHFVCQTAGASGTIEAQAFAEFSTAATTALTVNIKNSAAITVDTTVDEALTVTAQWGTSDAANTITLREMIVEILHAGSGTTPGVTTIQEEGSDLTTRSKLNFVGSGLTAADDSANGRTNVTLDTELNAIAGLTSAADKGIQFTGAGTAATYDLTAAGKALLDDADATAQRTTLGLGALATLATVGSAQIDSNAVGLTKLADIPSDRLLGRDTASSGDPEEISVTGGIEFSGSGSIQTSAFTGDVTKTLGGTALTIPNNTVTYAKMQDVSATDKLLGRSTAGSGDVEEIACTAAGRALLDDADATAQRTTLGLGTAATQPASATSTASTIPIADSLGKLADAWVRPGSYSRRNMWVLFTETSGATASPKVFGLPASPTVNAAGGASGNADAGSFPAYTAQTNTTSGNPAGIISAAFTYFRRNWKPVMIAKIKTGGSIGARFWVGFCSADISGSNDPTSSSVAAFTYEAGVDGTAFWRSYTANGSTSTRTATSQSIATGTEYIMRIELDASEIRFYINDALVRTETSTLPAATTDLGYIVEVTTTAAANRVITIGSAAFMMQ